MQRAYGILAAFGTLRPSSSQAIGQKLLLGEAHIVGQIIILGIHQFCRLNEPQIKAAVCAADFSGGHKSRQEHGTDEDCQEPKDQNRAQRFHIATNPEPSHSRRRLIAYEAREQRISHRFRKQKGRWLSAPVLGGSAMTRRYSLSKAQAYEKQPNKDWRTSNPVNQSPQRERRKEKTHLGCDSHKPKE